MEPLLLKPAEAAEMLRVSRARVYELLAGGELPTIKIGKFTRIPMSALREWVAEHSQTTPSVP